MIDRRAKLNVDAPYLLKKFMGVEFLLFRQRNTLDKRERTLTIDAWREMRWDGGGMRTLFIQRGIYSCKSQGTLFMTAVPGFF